MIFKLVFFLLIGCSSKKVFDSQYYCQKLKFDCLRKNQMVTFKTSKGNFEVKLNGQDYPLTVSNFIRNIKNNIYSNKRFYKTINLTQVKVIHAGINPGNNLYQLNNQYLNKIRPSIPLEISLRKEIEPVYKYQIKDPSSFRYLKKFFKRGSIAMVKNGEINSSATEFFFVTNKIPELDGRYSIFGKIVKGLEVLEKIDKKDFIYEIKISN